MDSDPLRIPVPPMLKKRVSGLPIGLYRVHLDGGLVLLIAETASGYVGVPLKCPHQDVSFVQNGMVDPKNETLFCQFHCITYSLETGEAVENLGAKGDDPGRLKLYEVTREEDLFIIRSFG